MKLGPVRIVWLLLGVLAAFVIFIQCLATVGGDHGAIPHPIVTTGPTPTLAPGTARLDGPASAYWPSTDFSSNTRSPLS